MSEGDMPQSDSTVDRRRFIETISVLSTAGIAGCGGGGGGGGDGGGGGGGDGDNQGSGSGGERVPKLIIEYWSDVSRTTVKEDAIPILQENMEALGLSVEFNPVAFTTQVNNVFDAKRHHYAYWFHNSSPDRLDPREMTRRYAADWAGGNGLASPNQYMNCEHIHPAIQQTSATSEEERQELVTEAHSIMSNEKGTVPFARTLTNGIYRSDMVNPDGFGEMGITQVNPAYLIKSSPTESDTLTAHAQVTSLETSNYLTLTSVQDLGIWNHLVYGSLLEYNENRKLENGLASDYSVEDDAQRIVVELRDATFTNGDPVTAEDVEFTYNHLNENQEVFPRYNYEIASIETIDEETVAFNFDSPSLPFITQSLVRWGIFHKETWIEAGAQDNPEEVQFDEFVGSGPFEVVQFQPGRLLQLNPHDGHPKHQPDHNVVLQGFSSGNAAVRALEQGEIQFAMNVSPATVSRVEDGDLSDIAEIAIGEGFIPHMFYPQHNLAPVRYHEFNDAVGTAMNRARINEVAFNGMSEEIHYSCPLLDNHPYFPGEENLHTFTDDPQGDVEAARAILEEEGWSWDSDGNLLYPEDREVENQYPPEGLPDYDEWPCLDSEGNYNG